MSSAAARAASKLRGTLRELPLTLYHKAILVVILRRDGDQPRKHSGHVCLPNMHTAKTYGKNNSKTLTYGLRCPSSGDRLTPHLGEFSPICGRNQGVVYR